MMTGNPHVSYKCRLSMPTLEWDFARKFRKCLEYCQGKRRGKLFFWWYSLVVRTVRTGVVRGHCSVVGGTVGEVGPVTCPVGTRSPQLLRCSKRPLRPPGAEQHAGDEPRAETGPNTPTDSTACLEELHLLLPQDQHPQQHHKGNTWDPSGGHMDPQLLRLPEGITGNARQVTPSLPVSGCCCGCPTRWKDEGANVGSAVLPTWSPSSP